MKPLLNVQRLCRFVPMATAALLSLAGTQALAQSTLLPLPRCDAGSRSFYLMRYFNPTASGIPPTVTLDLTTIPASGATTRQQIWAGAGAPPVSPREIARAPNSLFPAGASVAGGMGKDGFIYAMRAVDDDNAWDNSPAAGWGSTQGSGWRTHTRHYEMLRYGRDGVENLGMVSGLGEYWTDPTNAGTAVAGAVDYRLGPNFNAADINPVDGHLYVANFQTGGALNRIHVIDVTQSPPALVNTLTLSGNIPGTQSGDFAIDANGQYAYGIARSGASSRSYRIDLGTGAVVDLGNPGLVPALFPYGAGARLLDGTFVFYGASTYQLDIATGALSDGRTTATANSADAASCLPKFTATLACTPASLVDAPANVATCTVTLDESAPAGGLDIALTPPPSGSPRYSSSCGPSITVAAGATTAQCTITATANTIPGDGDVTVPIGLATPASGADYVLGTPNAASVLIQNDDLPTISLVCTPTELFDADNQVSTCTISSNAPAPAGGLTVSLVPPTANPRYTSTCGSSITLDEGASSSTCTITATPNTVPGDGDVMATIQVQAGPGHVVGPDPEATVAVRNDDQPVPIAASVAPVPALGLGGLLAMALGLAGFGWRSRRGR